MTEAAQDIIAKIISTENARNGKFDIPSTPEGRALACGSLIIMALCTVLVGSLRSVNHLKEHKTSGSTDIAFLSRKVCALAPLIASGTLLSQYFRLQDQKDPKEGPINKKDQLSSPEDNIDLLTIFYTVVGVFCLYHLLRQRSSDEDQSNGQEEEHIIFDYSFKSHDIFCLICCLGIGVWYSVEKHWIANNMFGIALAAYVVKSVFLNNVVNGCILLGGFLLYDVFWVFGTNVIHTVAESCKAPVILRFPKDLLENGFSASNFAHLGVADILIPGVFIALVLRFDLSLKRKSRVYFCSTLFAYFVGLLTSFAMGYYFKHGQPALLYLVPACIFTPMTLALYKGDIRALIQYEDYPPIVEGTYGNGDTSREEKKNE